MFRTQSPYLVPPSVFLPAGKRSPASSKALAVLFRSFDDDLLRRLKTLDPPAVSFAWLARAVDVLVSTVADAEALISDLKLAGSEKCLAAYLDDSVKVLDVCNSVSAEIERLRQGRLLVNFVLHLLRRSGEETPEDVAVLARARDSLAEYRRSERSGGGRFDKPATVIRDLVQGLGSPPKGKISTEEKLLRRTVYAVGVVTVFVLGATVAVLDSSPGPMPSAEVHGDFSWAETLNRLSTALGDKIRERFTGETRRSADEAEAMEKGVASVSNVIDVHGDFSWAETLNRLSTALGDKIRERFTGETRRSADEAEAMEKGVASVSNVIDTAADVDSRSLVDVVNALGTVTEDWADRLDQLLNGVNGFFGAVLSTRNAFLQNFRR
ncbi:UPF0496 protein 4-like [Aristolochia californica]|uniref:UPF0496 protein 4-like n=1 Tax=Aristolochia californica TaxID=171875 RepID=UPI0035DD33EC